MTWNNVHTYGAWWSGTVHFQTKTKSLVKIYNWCEFNIWFNIRSKIKNFNLSIRVIYMWYSISFWILYLPFIIYSSLLNDILFISCCQILSQLRICSNYVFTEIHIAVASISLTTAPIRFIFQKSWVAKGVEFQFAIDSLINILKIQT